MANTTTTAWADSVQKLWDSDYLLGVVGNSIYNQKSLIKRKKVLGGERGSSVEFPVYELLTPATDTLDQNNDVTPVTSADNAVNISLAEKGNAVRVSRMLQATAYTDVHKAAAEQVAINFTESMELLARYVFINGTWFYRPSGVARASLTRGTAGHLITNANLANMIAQARSLKMPALPGGGFAGLTHPALIAGLLQDGVIQLIGEYQTPGNINLLTGEIGQFQGVRFAESPYGKVYYGGGTVAQAATTIAAAITAGDTTFTITGTTGCAVGDYWTIGTLEAANTETVQITSIAATPVMSIMGVGNTETTNMGFKFAHTNGAACTEAQNVAALVIVGPQSVGQVYSSITGPNGKISRTEPSMAIPGRFTDFSWYEIVGWGRLGEKKILRAEFATPADFLGYTEVL